MADKYVLNGKIPVSADLMSWGRWFETADLHVAQDIVGDVMVSTVFLGIDHNWSGGPPLLFETMIFGGPPNNYQTRCSTWEEAEAQHAEAVALVRSSLN